jgi:hypothetical protein
MPVNLARLRSTVQSFDWKPMFTKVLKWNNTTERPWSTTIDGQKYTLTPVAQMADMHVYVSTSASGLMPIQAIRRQIENQVKQRRFEHIIIFEDGAHEEAIYQWIKRGQGAAHSREFAYHDGQSGDLLIQRLSGIAFDFSDLDAQGRIDIATVTARVAKQFDVEGITKRFYDDFARQRATFQQYLRGIPLEDEQRWYVSVMLNRLMFIYFIQAKRFLKNDPEYLQTQLALSKAQLGPDHFYSDFLQLLFFEGFVHEQNDRSAAARERLGDIPYLNGGLFMLHAIEEKYGAAILIPDAAFEKLFVFFSSWRWHLSERPGVSDREIDPNVLGYIFEKYINQKQMGAYYTKEDITGYICRNTIIPALFDKANLALGLLDLPKNIAAYLYPALKQIERLPTETDREYATRQSRVCQLTADAQAGTIATINDAITANLNIEAMIFDLVPFLDAQPLNRLYQALISLSILDPTCGSGAFLFAALKILKPIYEQTLDRMALLAERRKTDGMPFRAILDAEQAHPNRDYFITKSIVVRNLYGVDIMEEAIEICKLRLFLRLVADLDDAAYVEPLPDIDFNIRAGNALVGYTGTDEIGGMLKGSVASLPPRQQRMLREVEVVQNELKHYRTIQLEVNASSEVFRQTRQEIREKNAGIDAALDDDMLKIGQIHREPGGGFNTQPLHWFTAFYEILSSGGFDVIVGNPPYVGYTKVKSEYRVHGYRTEKTGNLYAFTVERALNLLRTNGRFGMIVPIASVSTDGMAELQTLYKHFIQWHSHFAVRPGKLFVGVDMNLTISLLQKTRMPRQIFTTGYRRWSSGAETDRPFVFMTLMYTNNPQITSHANPYPKLGSVIEEHILCRMHKNQGKLKDYISLTGEIIYYHSGGRYWRKALPKKLSSHYKPVTISKSLAPVVFALLNSQLFYWYWISNSNCMDVVSREVFDLPVFQLNRANFPVFENLRIRLLESYYENNSIRVRRGEIISLEEINFDVQKSKPIIDEIDRVLAQHYGFTDQELDFIINYDIKYRMGRSAEDAGDGE